MSHFTRRHFHDIDIKDLIHQYKQYDCLWNYNSPDYKNKATKQEAWWEIANYFKKDANEVKRKIKYLRSAYVSEKRKVDNSRKSGTETYKPSLFYYNELDFLDDIVVLRKYENDAELDDFEFKHTNISQDTEYNEELMSHSNSEDIDIKQPEINCKVETFAESELEISVSPQPPINNSPKILYSQSLSSRAVKRKVSGEIKFKKSPTLASKSNAQRKILYMSFGKTIALQLQQLPLEVAIVAMSEIQAILTKTSLEQIRTLQKGGEARLYSESENSSNEQTEEDFNHSS